MKVVLKTLSQFTKLVSRFTVQCKHCTIAIPFIADELHVATTMIFFFLLLQATCLWYVDTHSNTSGWYFIVGFLQSN